MGWQEFPSKIERYEEDGWWYVAMEVDGEVIGSSGPTLAEAFASLATGIGMILRARAEEPRE